MYGKPIWKEWIPEWIRTMPREGMCWVLHPRWPRNSLRTIGVWELRKCMVYKEPTPREFQSSNVGWFLAHFCPRVVGNELCHTLRGKLPCVMKWKHIVIVILSGKVPLSLKEWKKYLIVIQPRVSFLSTSVSPDVSSIHPSHHAALVTQEGIHLHANILRYVEA